LIGSIQDPNEVLIGQKIRIPWREHRARTGGATRGAVTSAAAKTGKEGHAEIPVPSRAGHPREAPQGDGPRDGAKQGLAAATQTWSEAQSAAQSGNFADAVAKANTVKEKAISVMQSLGLTPHLAATGG